MRVANTTTASWFHTVFLLFLVTISTWVSPLVICAGAFQWALPWKTKGVSSWSQTNDGFTLMLPKPKRLYSILNEGGGLFASSPSQQVESPKRTRRKTAEVKAKADRGTTTAESATKTIDATSRLCLRYSHLFQRHVVYRPRRGRLSFYWNGTASNLFCSPDDDCDEVIASFRFLDEALEAYPNVKMVKLPEACFDVGEIEIHRSIVSGGGLLESTAYRKSSLTRKNDTNNTVDLISVSTDRTQQAYETLVFLSSLAYSSGQGVDKGKDSNEISGGDGQEQMAFMLADRVGKRRFLVHSHDSIRRNYDRIMDLFTRGDTSLLPPGLAMDESTARRVIANFPQVCLYDYDDVEERVQFFLNPLPPLQEMKRESSTRRKRAKSMDTTELDWPRLSNMGYGAGFTIQQATDAIRVVPQLLAINHDDALKPNLVFFYQRLDLPFELFEEARSRLDVHLIGATASDVWTMAFLYSLGVSWEQIEILLDAFPTLVCCDTEPSWELIDHGPVRSVFDESVLHYLRKRLQIRPSEVFAMMKTHSRLSTYKAASKIKPTLDAFESRAGFSSKELQTVIMRMPSLIGMSVKSENAGLNQRLTFFYREVGMSEWELRKAVLRQPSLFQYSVEQSLRPKLNFFLEYLQVPPASVRRIITTCPSIMGLSLEENLLPTSHAIMDTCGLDKEEMGVIVARVPQILASSLKRNLEPKLRFLSKYMNLSKDQLGQLVQTMPRTLIQSVESSLKIKLQMIEAALEYEANSSESPSFFKTQSRERASAVVLENPSLLVTANDIVKKRLGTYMQNPSTSLSDALLSRARKAKGRDQKGGQVRFSRGLPRRRRSVLVVDAVSQETLEEFPNVETAAAEYDMTASRMYHIIRNERQLDGMKFVYGEVTARAKPDAPTWDYKPIGDSSEETASPNMRQEPATNSTGLVGAIRNSVYRIKSQGKSDAECLEIFVSGQVYPPDDINRVRGFPRFGGLAVYFPQVYHGGVEFSKRLRRAAKASFGQVMPGSAGGSNYTNGTILVGFPYLRPSRNRCSLVACHVALRVVLQLLKQASVHQNLEDVNFDITVHTDSDYAWKLLNNNTRVLEWGSYPTMDDFEYEKGVTAPDPKVNPDILFPFSQTYKRIVRGELTDETGKPLVAGKHINISFRHSSESLLERGQQERNLWSLAKRAAVWQYNRSRRPDLHKDWSE